jgi:hypothetical protein
MMMCREECQAQNKGDQLGVCLEVWPCFPISPLEKELGCESARLLDVLVPRLGEPSTRTNYVANSSRIGGISKWNPHGITIVLLFLSQIREQFYRLRAAISNRLVTAV